MLIIGHLSMFRYVRGPKPNRQKLLRCNISSYRDDTYIFLMAMAQPIAMQNAACHMQTARRDYPKEIEMAESKSATRQGERTASEFTGSTRDFAEQSAGFTRDAAGKTIATAKETTRAASEVYSAFTASTLDFQRHWIEMVRENTNVTLDFVHQALGVKSPSEFVELSAEHARKQFEAFAEQARQLTGIVQKMTADLAAPMGMAMKSALDRAA